MKYFCNQQYSGKWNEVNRTLMTRIRERNADEGGLKRKIKENANSKEPNKKISVHQRPEIRVISVLSSSVFISVRRSASSAFYPHLRSIVICFPFLIL